MTISGKEKHEHLAQWFKVKERRHNTNPARLPKVKEGDVYWVAVGENVGVEINGKGELFSRPVLVYKRLSQLGFMGIPLTSQQHHGSWYVQLRFQGKLEYAVLSQARVFSTSRLYDRIGQIAEDDMSKIKVAFLALYS